MTKTPLPSSLARTLGFALAGFLVVVDQSTKAWARAQLDEPVDLGPFLNLILGFNRGVSFGLLSADGDAGRWLLVTVTGLIAAAMLVEIGRSRRQSMIFALALVAGGALGNIVDRVRSGAVTDFIDVHIGKAHWPTFNLADAAIVLGVAALIFLSARYARDDGAVEIRR